MASSMVISGTVFHLIFILFWSTTANNLPYVKIFNVGTYGAVPDGKTDVSNQFLSAWRDACQYNGSSIMYIPAGGIYMLNPVTFDGDCNGATGVRIEGFLKASTHPSTLSSNCWITFEYIDQLVIDGGGTLDGQGSSVWNCPNCKRLLSLCFNFVTNAILQNVELINSKSVHTKLYSCKKFEVIKVRIRAPANSPNTDGINIAECQDIQVKHCNIGTGDDCISMLSGNQNVTISDVVCGPGHGISVGSLGKGPTETVRGLHVKNCSFSGTQNGLRIKTWAPSLPSFVSDFVYEDIHMEKADNPIIIDQNYCPNWQCNPRAQSSVQINNVTFKNIWGESGTQVAVAIKCSGIVPCTNIELDDINLVYNGRDGAAKTECSNILHGQSFGQQHPPGCIHKIFT